VIELDPLFLTLEEVLDVHADQLRLFGGTAGIRDHGSLESAIATPSATFSGAFLHGTIWQMAAAYAFHIAQNQPFLDGNKRVGLNACLLFLALNGWEVVDPGGALYDGMIGFADGSMNKSGFADLLRSLSVPSDSMEA